jgi:hypothetical protein
VIDGRAPPPELVRDTPIAVAGELPRDRLDRRPQRGIGRGHGLGARGIGPPVVATIVLTAHSKHAYDAALPAFRCLVGSYAFVTDSITIGK